MAEYCCRLMFMPHMNNVDIDAVGSCNRNYEMPNGTSLILANSFPVILQA